jgi:hypothetical protein
LKPCTQRTVHWLRPHNLRPECTNVAWSDLVCTMSNNHDVRARHSRSSRTWRALPKKYD